MESLTIIPALASRELADLRRAKLLLEQPSFALRLADLIGAPIERGIQALPLGWSSVIQRSTHRALLRALRVAAATLHKGTRQTSADSTHRMLVMASGGIGGAFGLAALPFELPISTTLILRSIADIARSEGHALKALDTRMACLEVFAIGGGKSAADAAENAYWTLRLALAKAVTEATVFVTNRSLAQETGPALLRFVTTVGSRFGVVVSEQIAAKAVPIIGALSGSAINLLFMNHFQQAARGHFIIKRLETRYGFEPVRQAYKSIALPVRRARFEAA